VAFSLRPSFELELDVPSGELIEQLVLTVLPEARHFWSPWLTLDIGPRGEGTHVSGTFSPHPSVWTAYMFGYLALGIVLLFSLLFAGSVVMMGGGAAWSLWIAGGAVAGGVAMWWVSVLGQKLATAQMDELRGALTQVIAHVIPSA